MYSHVFYVCSDGGCSSYKSCLSCQLDAACGWCNAADECVLRSEQLTRSANRCGGSDPDQWIITGKAAQARI